MELWAEELGLYSEGVGSHRRFRAEEEGDLTQVYPHGCRVENCIHREATALVQVSRAGGCR